MTLLKGKSCGQTNKGKRQVNEQRNDGRMKTSSRKCVKSLLRLRFARLAAKQRLQSSIKTRAGSEQTHTAANVTRQDAKSVGMREAGLIVGHLAPTSMALRHSSSLICITNKRENVRCVGLNRRPKEVCMSITAMQRKGSEVFSATDVTLALGLSRKTPKFSQKQSVI